MCPNSTLRGHVAAVLLMALLCVPGSQSVLRAAPQGQWRQVGNTALRGDLAAPAGGPVLRAWYAPEGGGLFVQARNGRVWVTADFESWQESEATPPAPLAASLPAGGRLPEQRAVLFAHPSQPAVHYALGRQLYRSQDDGRSWASLTAVRQQCLIGDGLLDVALSPQNAEEIVVAGRQGVWRSLDAGLTWSALHAGLPNLPVRRIVSVEQGSRVELQAVDGEEPEDIEWVPGEKVGWESAGTARGARESARWRAIGRVLNAPVTAFASAGDQFYAGSHRGRLWSSADGGRTWREFAFADAGTVTALFVDPAQPSLALATLAGQEGAATAVQLARTTNGGLFWDDLTGDLPVGSLYGVTADRATGSVYVAGTAGLAYAVVELQAASPGPASWQRLAAGLPAAPAWDVRLDAAANQLYVALDGHGVFASLAPHRQRSPRLVSAADLQARVAAPGSLLTVLGTKVVAASVGGLSAPLLQAGETESQIQVPFEAPEGTLPLSLESAAGALRLEVPLRAVSPAVFVGPDGAPLVLDADTGLMLDAMRPARSQSRVQVLATGLGRVVPEWPTGLAAPLQEPPRVIAPVRAYLDRVPVEVTRATLAPGYIGLYLVELVLPRLVNAGPAELYLEAGDRQSNRVRVFLEP